jgi:hypothetical protein
MRTFQRTANALAFEPLLARLLAQTPWADVARIAEWLSADDPYRESDAVGNALTALGIGGSVHAHVEHQLWCAWREAAWTSRLAEPLAIRVTGEPWLAETAGYPTILITPMTLSVSDSLHAIASLRGGRSCVVFGEAVGHSSQTHGLEIVTGDTPAAARRIRAVLEDGGSLCTYVDFVYDGHAAETLELFGIRRPVSAGFVSLAARNNTMLLPVLCLRESNEMTVQIDEPYLIKLESREPLVRAAARDEVTRVVGTTLERQLRVAREQWLLLPTLTFESPQMAGSQAAR